MFLWFHFLRMTLVIYAPFVSAENVFRKTFSAFAGVWCNVKQKSN